MLIFFGVTNEVRNELGLTTAAGVGATFRVNFSICPLYVNTTISMLQMLVDFEEPQTFNAYDAM